jgi:hypothetical protein
VACGFGVYLDGASAGVKLDAFGVAVPPGGSPWWAEQRRAERDAAIRALAATFPGSASAWALATAEALRRYDSVGWRLDRRRGGPRGGDPRRRLLFAIFAADPDPPTSMRRIYNIIVAESIGAEGGEARLAELPPGEAPLPGR